MVVPSLPAMTNIETADEIADWLASNLAALGLKPVADELTESYGDEVPPPLRRLRLAAALSGACDRMMWDAINETGAAAYDAGALEAAARQRAQSFDPGGQLGADNLHGVHFGLFLQQRIVSAGAFDDPTDPNPSMTDPLLFTAGLAMNVAIGVIRFGMTYASGDMLRLANQAGGTFTILNELKRFCDFVLAPPESSTQHVGPTRGPRPRPERGAPRTKRPDRQLCPLGTIRALRQDARKICSTQRAGLQRVRTASGALSAPRQAASCVAAGTTGAATPVPAARNHAPIAAARACRRPDAAGRPVSVASGRPSTWVAHRVCLWRGARRDRERGYPIGGCSLAR